MMTKPSCILFVILILTWLSGGDATCTLPPSWTAVTDDNNCCTGTSCANTDCIVSQVGCADGYTLKSGAATTATCDTSSAWSVNPTDICLQKCDVPPGWTVAADDNSCCTGTSCTADCVVSQIGCDTGYTLKSGVTTTATCNAAEDGQWGAAVATICLKKCDVPTGWTVAVDTNSCCTGTSCTADCEVSQIGCDTGYTLKSGATTTATCNADGDGQWGAAVETICLKKCDVPTGATAATTTGSCCAATDISCPAACVVTVFDCATGYTKQSGVVTAATCNASGDGEWSAPVISGLCVKDTTITTAVTTTATGADTATTTTSAATITASGAGHMSWTKSTILFASCVMMLIF